MVKLNQSGTGGYIGCHLINHLCYAADLFFISLSSAGMQLLLDLCSTYAIEHFLTYNGSKSYYLRFKPKHTKFYAPTLYLRGFCTLKFSNSIFLISRYFYNLNLKYVDYTQLKSKNEKK